MKGFNISCASQASTAICTSMEKPSSSSSASSSSAAPQSVGGRAIDRHNPIIRDGRRVIRSSTLTAPSSSDQMPASSPKPNLQQKGRKKNMKKLVDFNKKGNAKPVTIHDDHPQSRKKSLSMPSDLVLKGCTARPGDYITPPESSRYLLDDRVFLDGLPDLDPILAPPAYDSTKKAEVAQTEAAKTPKPPSTAASSHQVVVLRVSLHCKGCEGKVRKHISRMEGVTSYSIDFAAKKVTVIGDVTPLGVLASISKVKNAQLWTPATSSSSPSWSAFPSRTEGLARH
ncbi:hypothetical protein Nepgr_011968 [Nepenthes gracilis]|uniref:HMA domain-containing protein n=1 Tax=Nepenthes gracilis TaxID=150966 RepID=A0AAD3SGI0_NEPGR|nr:hypothetical protein Nepgr_011968 [Nepenthes gracilis]